MNKFWFTLSTIVFAAILILEDTPVSVSILLSVTVVGMGGGLWWLYTLAREDLKNE